VQAYPYVVFGVGVFLGWFFNRSRVVFALVALAVADRAWLHFAAGTAASAGVDRGVFDAVALLLPLNLLAIAWTGERGVFTARGLSRLVAIPLQILGIGVMLLGNRPIFSTWLQYPVIDARLTAWTPIAQPALVAFGVTLISQATRFVLHEDAIEAGLLWTVVAAFVGLHGAARGWLPTSFFATAGLVLIVALIETSYRMAYHDDLTGLPGRRALNEALRQLGSRYVVAMLDIDHFKKFNDAYGHDVGDQVLRMVASKLGRITGGGRAFRYGGEEFTLIFPGRSAGEAITHLEALRITVAGSGFVLRGSDRPRKKPAAPRMPQRPSRGVFVTVSIGVAERDSQNTDPQQVVRAADKALYRAKKAGRNRVMV
jgi:diguanylate cyclase (GGDEF)-like protein